MGRIIPLVLLALMLFGLSATIHAELLWPEYCDTCDYQDPGDANGDGLINDSDLAFIIDFLYADGTAPDPMANGDPNGDCCIDDDDINYLVDYLAGGPPPVDCTCQEPDFGGNIGDANEDGEVDVEDNVFLISFLAGTGPAPDPLALGDPDGNGCIDQDDIEYLIAFIFEGGPPPVDCAPWTQAVGLLVGDVNDDGSVDAADLTMLVDIRNGGTPTGAVGPHADVDGDCCITDDDVAYLQDFLFAGGPDPVTCTCLEPGIDVLMPGDVNGDGVIDVSDVAAILAAVTDEYETPLQRYLADVNADCCVDSCDAQYLIEFLFGAGDPPLSCPCYEPGWGGRIGDVNLDGVVDASDAAYLTNAITGNGPKLVHAALGDIDGDCCIKLADVDALTDFIFGAGPPPVECTCWEVGFGYDIGDVNSDGFINLGDITYLVDFLDNYGPAPQPLEKADVNGDCCVNQDDVDYLVDDLFGGGPPPVDCTCYEALYGGSLIGDVNGDQVIDLNDLTYLVSYVYAGGPAPVRMAHGDLDGDCCIGPLDVEILAGGPPLVDCTCWDPYGPCTCVPGDANDDGTVNISDAVYLIQYIFNSGPAPTPFATCSGDANCDCVANVTDAVFIIYYIFSGGPAPCGCCAWINSCDPPLRK